MPKSFEEFRALIKSGSEIIYPTNQPTQFKDLMDISIDNQALLETILENQAFIMAKMNYPNDAEKFQNAHHEFFKEMERDAHEKSITLRAHFAKMLADRDK